MSKKQINEVDISKLIFKKLEEKERDIAWLARRLNCDKSNLTKRLKNSKFMYCDILLDISDILDEDFFVYYSQSLKEREKQQNTL